MSLLKWNVEVSAKTLKPLGIGGVLRDLVLQVLINQMKLGFGN
jgi:hypothetical protein